MQSITTARIADLRLCGPPAAKFYASSRTLGQLGFDLDRFEQAWSHMIHTGMGVVFLLWNEGEVVGALGGVEYPDMYSAEKIATEFFWFVCPEHRGGGADLYKRFEAWARERKCSQIRMGFLHDSMPERLSVIYKRWGFTPAETLWVKDLPNAA